jgi:AcrR family transcriptional regulator
LNVTARGRLRRNAGERTRERILDAAEEIFVRFGYEGARMDQIAEAAGVRKANIYYYFPGKDELYRALVDRTLAALTSGIHDFLGLPAASPWDQVDGFLDMFFRLVERYRGLIGLAYGEILHPPREAHGAAMGELIAQIEEMGARMIADGIAAGVYRVVDPVQTIVTLEGAIFHWFLTSDDRIRALTGRGKFDPANLAERRRHLSDLFRRLLAPDA